MNQLLAELRMLEALMFDPRPKSTVHRAKNEIEALTAQRDELLGVLRHLLKMHAVGACRLESNYIETDEAHGGHYLHDEWLHHARAAIALAEESDDKP